MSFGLAFQPETGYLYATENGPGGFDEVNKIEAGSELRLARSSWARTAGQRAYSRSHSGVWQLARIRLLGPQVRALVLTHAPISASLLRLS